MIVCLIYQGLLERNEMRGKALGISTNNSKIQPSPKKSSLDKENKSEARITDTKRKSLSSPRKSSNAEIVRSSTNKTPTKTRTVSSKTKDDADVAVEINITSSQHIQVRKRRNEVTR